MATLTGEQWGLKESADWWSAGQVLRHQIYRAATEMMLDMADVQPGSRVLDVAAGTGEQTLMAARRVGPMGYALAADISAMGTLSSPRKIRKQESCGVWRWM